MQRDNITDSRYGSGRIHIVKDPPLYVYTDELFEIGIAFNLLSKHNNNISSIYKVIKISAELCGVSQQGGTYSVPVSKNNNAQMEIEPTILETQINDNSEKNQPVIAKCKIKSFISNSKPTRYCIRFKESQGDVSFGNVEPVVSRFIQIVNAKIKVEACEKWPKVWYKDEGGRDKCLQAVTSLPRADNILAANRSIPLRVTLVYENEQLSPVLKQDILKILGPEPVKKIIDSENDKVNLQFRIEDVSKNHQGMNFMIEVSPDLPRDFDVAPAYTPPISVRSKRNKRLRTLESGTQSKEIMPLYRNINENMVTKIVNGYTDPGHNDRYPLIPRFCQAIKGLIYWTEEVLNGISPLKWKIIGYAQFPDGTVDYSRPYHSMNNPNLFISRIFSIYSNETRCHIHTLLSAVENLKHDPETNSVTHINDNKSADPKLIDKKNSPARNIPFQPPTDRYIRKNENQKSQEVYSYGQRNKKKQCISEIYWNPMEKHLQQQIKHPDIQISQMKDFFGENTTRDTSSAYFEKMQKSSLHENRLKGHVYFLLARQLIHFQTKEKLGFPAYSRNKELLGFYRESSMKVGLGELIPLSKFTNKFGPREMSQATRILQEAIQSQSQAVHSLLDWESLESMIDHALVYDWTRDIKGENSICCDIEIGGIVVDIPKVLDSN